MVLEAKDPAGAGKGRVLEPFALAFAALGLFGTISLAGIWDPPELEMADLSRRIALNLMGAGELSFEGGTNEVPTRADLGRGELPFTSVALGFRLLGLSDWAGRLPLALWGLAGVLSTYALVARLADRRAAAFSVLVLVTTPLFFLHARTMLGDIVTMSSFAIALAGLGIAVFDARGADESPARSRARRGLAAAAGGVGLLAGFFARGPLIGVAVPALGLGLTWLCLRMAGARRRERLGDGLATALLAFGSVVAFLGVRELLVSDNGEYSLWLGTKIEEQRGLPTFDSMILQLGHAAFPWSALLPLAAGRLLAAPAVSNDAARERESALRLGALIVATLAFGAQGALAPYFGVLPYAAVAVLAVIVGVALRDFERGAPASRGLAMTAAALTILLLADFRNFPDKALSAFAVAEARFPDSFKHFSERALAFGSLAFAGLCLFALGDRSSEGARRFDRAEYRRWYGELRALWSGNLLFAILVAEASLVGFSVLGVLSDRYFHLKQFEAMASSVRAGAAYAAALLPLAVVLPTVVTALRDAMSALTSPAFGIRALGERFPRWASVRLSRGMVALFAGVGFGAALSFAYYPALAAQISPKQTFSAYRELAKAGEPLGMIGSGSGSASYYAGRAVAAFESTASGFEWLMEPGPRRWLVIRSSDLAPMNSMFRAKRKANLPVLDGRSSEILLVSSTLLESETNHNPFRDWFSSSPPNPKHPLDANLGGQLDVLGWNVLTESGVPVDAVEPGRRYRFVIYYKVVAAISGNWETFIHIDGFQRRFNADHPTLEGRYPFNLWRVGDYVADGTSFELEPNFTPGDYRVFLGLYSGSRRLEVKRGRHEENRLDAGSLHVR